MKFLIGNKLVKAPEEQTSKRIVAIPSAGNSSYYDSNKVQDAQYTLTFKYGERGSMSGYYFKCTQSPWSDGSGLGVGIDGIHITIGDAISGALRHDYKIYIDGEEMDFSE